ncbi:unnamed protein product [Urochloa humidicola]
MAGKPRRKRRCRTDRSYTCNRSEHIICNRSELLDTINGFYAAALDRLPVDEMPALVPRLLKAGLCIGFSDPVTNIIVNTVSSWRNRVPEHNSDAGKKNRRQKALSRAVADTGNVKSWPPYRPLLRDMPVATRSLEALVAFLTYSFRYLPVSEALEYLRLAKADLREAVRLIEEDRNSGGSFSFASWTTRTALKCAALAAWHPKPRALVNRSYSLASRIEEVSQLLVTEGRCLSCSAIETINRLLKRRRKIQGLTGFSPPQFLHEQNKQPPFITTKSLKSVLLDKIYGLYIDALAQMPQDVLRQRYHRGFLIAGHCYGPLKNPVSNIVLNTVWYETMFPRQDELSVTMICSRSLVRVACRSLRGLVAYICASFDMISEHQAMRYLLLTEVSLWEAIEMAQREGHTESTLSDQDSAYEAAATAAMHPEPDAVVKFLVLTYPMMVSLQMEPFVLDVQLLSQMLMQYCSTHSSVQTVPAALSEGGSKVLSWIQRDFKEEERFVLVKVNAALKKYTQQTGGPEYEVHVICGLNSNVGISSYVFGLHYGPGHMRPRKSQYSHINFLASQRDYLQSSDAVPILFFAECSNNEDVTDESSCWPVMGHPGRCFYCENEGAKIVHSDMTKYNGRDTDFERMACENLGGMTVDDSGSRLVTDCIDVCEEDCIYFDASRDLKCAEFLNARARIFECGFLV